jgi:tetratricopeptide (TPR) repeat protein
VNFINCAAALLPSDGSFLAQGQEQAAAALQLSPRRQETYFAWAKLESAAGRRERALAIMQTAVALDPEVGECQFFLALLEFDAGRAQDGFAALEAAAHTGRTPRTPAELKLVGGQFADAGDYRRALAMFNQALALAPGDLETQLKLGLAYYSVGDANAARQYIGGVAQATDLSATPAWATLKPILDELGIAARK